MKLTRRSLLTRAAGVVATAAAASTLIDKEEAIKGLGHVTQEGGSVGFGLAQVKQEGSTVFYDRGCVWRYPFEADREQWRLWR